MTNSTFSECHAPCWIRTNDRLLRRLAVVGLKSLAMTGFAEPKTVRCEQKCEQFARFGAPAAPSSEGLSGLGIEAGASAKEPLSGGLAALLKPVDCQVL